ncbi:hypothetical protein [Enterobacter cloacae]|uniref:hypothetical protein n=1 Tax=Enterobacter cloacae TaxID=550 RepID=UPI0018C24A17|nr:hypothetical protein [Enterobacter cloacae]ELV2768411.1 hypothetical protein [Enterobacter cloacae]ELV2777291.1 hypothetical protein [Enterobacter cloacae]MBG0521162.1 hypothetical protein [Enterobacter cloacae]HCT8370484.1 hypothetical protein [Enterobacter cloacae]
MITQKATQGLLVSTVKNEKGQYVAQVSGNDTINGDVTVTGNTIDDLINKIKPNVVPQPDFVWDGIKSAITELLP